MRWLAALSIAFTVVACSKTEVAPDPVRAVRTSTVSAQSAGGVCEFAGEVKARTESRLGFRVGGKIARRQADLGDVVKAGQVLAQLDPQDLRLGQDSARASLVAAQVNVDQAQADFKRFKDLRDQGFISSAELERRETALKAARAQLDQASAQSGVQGNQARYASLMADTNGVITGVDAEPGAVVAAGAPVLRMRKTVRATWCSLCPKTRSAWSRRSPPSRAASRCGFGERRRRRCRRASARSVPPPTR
jgi:membrane fusion protein, multidrug efflux system